MQIFTPFIYQLSIINNTSLCYILFPRTSVSKTDGKFQNIVKKNVTNYTININFHRKVLLNIFVLNIYRLKS